MEQLDVFQLARTDDPPTSHQAAERVLPKAGTVRARVLWLFTYRAWGGRYTDEQLIDDYRSQVEAGLFAPASDSSIRTRRSELVAGGWLEDSGETRTNRFGNEMVVWRLI